MKITSKDFQPRGKMAFAPVEEDDDDLSNLIKADSDAHDDAWQLTDDLDGTKLAAFWDDALKELGAESVEK